MAKTKPPYPAEFRQQMVELVHGGRTPAELAREFGCTAQTIANWVGAAGGGVRSGKSEGAPLSSAEREILSKATAWFAARGDKTFTPSTN